ncbi:CHY zinc finger protein [Pontibacillus salicampi]|uniref:CHY zinc finger protein n=1 Tax=Pontibacillus salicampi TaxID=1449801 RepID=A0ABV6LPJ3_9BACI
MLVKGHEVKGIRVDDATRCVHYHQDVDIIAIKFKCCGIYYSCYQCHEACADHTAELWKAEERENKAILCGVCGTELTIDTYMHSGYECPHCHASFNPGCRYHAHYYFE